MSATTTSPSPSPSVESDESYSGYDNCIREDLTGQVFVDFEVFIKHVLHVPNDWRTLWGLAINAVKADSAFNKHRKEYREHCDRIGSQKNTFHRPLMDTANAVLEVLSRSTFDNITPKVPHYYRVDGPTELLGGVTNNFSLSPDLVALHKDCQPSKEEDVRRENLLHVLEVKPYGGGLCDGKKIPRLVFNGKYSIGFSLDMTDVRNRSRPDPEPRISSQPSTTRRNEVYRVHNRFRVEFCVVQAQKAACRWIFIHNRPAGKEV